jgi:hypothetical protein
MNAATATESLTTTEIRITVTGRPALYWARETGFEFVSLASNPVDGPEELDLADDDAKIDEVLGEDAGLISQDIYLSDLIGLWVEGGEGADHSVGQIIAVGEQPDTVLVSWHGEEQATEVSLDGITVTEGPDPELEAELCLLLSDCEADEVCDAPGHGRMTTYRITNTASGHCLGDFEGETASDAIAAMLADAGDLADADADADPDLVADELTVYEPIARADRAGSTAPILPIRICVWAREVVAEYADWSPERYASLDALLSAHEMTREELGEQTN